MIVRVYFLFLLLFVAGLTAGAAAAEDGPQRILLIHSFGRDYEPFASVAIRFHRELAARSRRPIEIVEVSLQTISRSEPDSEDAIVDFLAKTFQKRSPDLVAAVGAPAAHFFDHHRDHLFPESPFLVMGADQRRVTMLADDPSTVCVNIELDVPGYLEGIVELLPDTEVVYVATGISDMEQFWLAEVRKVWSQSHPDIEVRPLNHLSLAAMLEFVPSLPPNSVLFHAVFDRDADGIPHEGHQSLRRLGRVSGVPVFGFDHGQVGEGIVGGRLIDIGEAGTRGAGAARRLLNGMPAAKIKMEPVVPTTTVYDWRELQRWRIAESDLPPGSTVRFRTPSVWESHRTAVLVGAGVMALQAILIFFLLAARRRARIMRDNFNLTAEAANVGLWHVDFDHNLIEATEKWREIFGFSPTDQIGMEDVFNRIDAGDQLPVRAAIEEAAHHGTGYALEFRIRRPDGEMRWISSRGRAERLDGSEQFKIRGVSVDITERKLSDEELSTQREQLSHLARVGSLGAISGSLAHELNQPLGTILSNAQAARRMLERDEPDLAEIREILDDIVGEDNRAERVIASWRSLLKRGHSVSEPVDVPGCIESLLRLIQSDFAEKDVTVEVNCDRTFPPVLADSTQVLQVLLNLLLNAADAMAAGPVEHRLVEVDFTKRDQMARISVRDHGPGIPGDPEKLFEPFHTTKEDGLGMGLAISRTLAVGHGGSLKAESAPDGGAAFILTLPLAESL